MAIKVGTIIQKDNEQEIVIKTINGVVEEKIPLRRYMEKHVMVQFDGRYQSLEEILDEYCGEYLKRCQTVEVSHSDIKTK